MKTSNVREGSGKNCAVFGCKNSSNKLRKWKLAVCEFHTPLTHDECACVQPYQMHRFPNGVRTESAAKLKEWLKNINRKSFFPNANSRVCSVHFKDGRPTSDYPYPVLRMGYKNYKHMSAGRRQLNRCTSLDTKMDTDNGQQNKNQDDSAEDHLTHTSVQTDAEPEKKNSYFQWYDFTLSDHNYAKDPVFSSHSKSTQTDHCPELSVHNMEDRTVKFYTGLSTSVFWSFVSSLLMWLPSIHVPNFKLAVHNQIFLVLMRLRLGLMFADLAARFNISCATANSIFATWLPHMAKYMKCNIIFWPPRDTLSRIRPKSFATSHPKATCIIDCTEVFVQRPSNLKKRAQTYSNYKNHNTYKALYCVAPNGFVTYVSKLFGGRASDTFISRNCGFGEHLLPGDEVLADRGFTISDILPPGVKLSIPAFTRGFKDRMLPEESVTETRRIANVRIHVERAIRRLKCYKILSSVIPASVQNVDDILIICAGLCNLQPMLINEKSLEAEE
ncbi:uncharacterized protein [Diadema antillarum]|uniref:uncharacterized protein n=1 Tax=Diadema antillarum TaxID=105358 RepID=UPI003A871CA9